MSLGQSSLFPIDFACGTCHSAALPCCLWCSDTEQSRDRRLQAAWIQQTNEATVNCLKTSGITFRSILMQQAFCLCRK